MTSQTRSSPSQTNSPTPAAFDSTRTHEVSISVETLECQEGHCLARLTRRDTLDGSIVSSFPQTLRLSTGPDGLVIEEIGR